MRMEELTRYIFTDAFAECGDLYVRADGRPEIRFVTVEEAAAFVAARVQASLDAHLKCWSSFDADVAQHGGQILPPAPARGEPADCDIPF